MNQNEDVRFVKLDERIEITLKSNASTGYVWQHVSKNDFDFLNARPNKQYDPNTMAVGSSIDMTYTLLPKREGEFILRFEQRRPWEKNSSPINVYEEVIMVQK